jgi:hypothetical protein
MCFLLLFLFYILCPAQFLLGLSKGTYGKNSERKKIVPTNPDLFFLLGMSNSAHQSESKESCCNFDLNVDKPDSLRPGPNSVGKKTHEKSASVSNDLGDNGMP